MGNGKQGNRETGNRGIGNRQTGKQDGSLTLPLPGQWFTRQWGNRCPGRGRRRGEGEIASPNRGRDAVATSPRVRGSPRQTDGEIFDNDRRGEGERG